MSNNIRPHIVLGIITLVLAVILLGLMLFPRLLSPGPILMPKNASGHISPPYHQVYASSYSPTSPLAGA